MSSSVFISECREKAYLANNDVYSFKVSAVHLGGFSRNWLYFHTDLLSFLSAIYRLVIHFNTGHNANIYKLREREKKGGENECKQYQISHKRFKCKNWQSGERVVLLLSLLSWKCALSTCLTPLVGTHSSVPVLSTPASTMTPMTMGSLELKINWGNIRSLLGNTAMCLKKRETFRYPANIGGKLPVFQTNHCNQSLKEFSLVCDVKWLNSLKCFDSGELMMNCTQPFKISRLVFLNCLCFWKNSLMLTKAAFIWSKHLQNNNVKEYCKILQFVFYLNVF